MTGQVGQGERAIGHPFVVGCSGTGKLLGAGATLVDDVLREVVQGGSSSA